MPGIDMAFLAGLAASLVKESPESLENLSSTQIEAGVKLALTLSHRFASVGIRQNDAKIYMYPQANEVNLYTRSKTTVIHCDREWMGNDGDWSIFNILQNNKIRVAADLIRRSPEGAVSRVPTARFCDLLTTDRIEIECFRSTAAVVHEYLQSDVEKPLSIAVFGQPGAGKSFGATQVIKAIIKDCGKEYEICNVNLSQFVQHLDLLDTFRNIVKISKRNEIPVVLFDEFDTFYHQKLGWLKYFLEVMQDGQFLDSGIAQPLKRAIFVFIGGTSSTFASFTGDINSEEAKQAKKPDFVSSLSAYIDIRGPNQNGKSDKMYPIRRALILRHSLKKRLKSNGDGIDVDPKVLKALLEYPVFRHGARSIELILQMSRLSGRHRFEASALPADNQLGMHVDIDDFKEPMIGLIPGTDLHQIDSSLRAANRPIKADYGLNEVAGTQTTLPVNVNGTVVQP